VPGKASPTEAVSGVNSYPGVEIFVQMATNINSVEELRKLYGAPTATSLKKQTDSLNETYRQWLNQSCFFVIASVGADGADCTPRGDKAGRAFSIIDNKTILIPDRRGNNRLDTLSNIIHDPRVALLFFITGVEQTLRVIGSATISADDKLLDHFALAESRPITCISVSIEAVYFQNTRAIARSELWTSQAADATAVPTPGQMIHSVNPEFDPDSYDAG